MSIHNRIAIVGHRGWASSAITRSLAESSSVPVKVLYRSGSDIADLPRQAIPVLVDFDDESTLVPALRDVDIVISLVGQGGVTMQHAIIKAIQGTDVQLFSPSDLAARYDEQGLQIPVNKNKSNVEKAAEEAGIPTTIILPGNIAQFTLNTRAMGVDLEENKIIYTGNSAEETINLCTRSYVAAAYASIFCNTPVSQLKNRTIGLSELRFTGRQLVEALEQKHGKATRIYNHDLSKVNSEIQQGLDSGPLFTLAWYCRKIWGTGQQATMIGADVWDLPGYPKTTLGDLIVRGGLGQYRDLPPEIDDYFRGTFTES